MDSQRVMAAAPGFGRPGDVAANAQAIVRRIKEAKAQAAALLVLPELCLTGSCGDILGHGLVLDACRKAALALAREGAGLGVALGLPVGMGGQAYNAAALLSDGKIQGLVLKNRLSWQEQRVFGPGAEAPADEAWPCPVHREGVGRFDLPGFGPLTVAFGADLQESPGGSLALFGACPARAGGGQARLKRVLALAGMGLCAWANPGGNESSTDQVYDGQTILIKGGRLLAASRPFSGDSVFSMAGGEEANQGFYPWEPDPARPYAPLDEAARAAWCREALEISARGLALRLGRIKARGLSLGLSGGLDSALALLAALRAFEIGGLDKKGLWALSLPAFGTSRRTRTNALKLMAACGLPERELDITASVASHLKEIGHPEGRMDAVFENAQARERTQVLMDLANQLGGVMIGPGDMSELALGFTTFGGDHMSMYGVNAGLYKTAIRLIVAQYARDTDNQALAEVLTAILDTPISPELLPGEAGGIRQKTEAILGPYLLNDFFLHHFLLGKLSPEEMLKRALDAFEGRFLREELLSRMRGFFTRFFASQFKRSCLPDGPQVLGLSLSPRGGLHLPSDASAALWLSALEALEP